MPSQPKSRGLTARTADRHVLYERAVQSIGADLKFLDRMVKQHTKRLPMVLREDFCGTAALATAFVKSRPGARAYGVDLHGPTLEWGLKHHIARLPAEAQRRITLLEENVLNAVTPPVDAVLALNFSYSVFKTRELLREYFTLARQTLKPGGLFILDAFGGTEAIVDFTERRKLPASETLEGDRVPPFTYLWEQARFDVISHALTCHIHFEFRDGSQMRKAFTYDWRHWTLPELQELMREAGFKEVEVYLHGWHADDGTSDGAFRKWKRYENAESWLGYVVGVR